MGNCTKSNLNKISSNNYFPLYQQLILKIYTEEDASPQQLKPLLEYLESNQIRISDTVLIVQNQIQKTDYPLRITVSLEILYGVMGLIKQSLVNLQSFQMNEDEEKIVQNDSRLLINSEVSYAYQNKQRLLISMNNIIKSLSKIFMEKQCFLKEIFLSAIKLLTILVESNELFPYGDSITQTLESVVLWYLVLYTLKNYPDVEEFQQIVRKLIDQTYFQQTAQSIEDFQSLFNLYIQVLKFEMIFSNSSKLFQNENQQTIFELILWIYALSQNRDFQLCAGELITIYKQRALMCNKCSLIFKICTLNFKCAVWSDIQKAEKLFYLTMINDDNNFQISALNIITDYITDSKTLLMNISTQDYPATKINQLQPVQFKKYLDFNQSQIDVSRSSSMTIQKQISQKFSTQIYCLQSACRCLQLLVEDMRSVEFLFYQSELIFIRLLEFHVYTVKFADLSQQIVKTLKTFTQRFSINPETSIRVIQIIIQRVYDQIHQPYLSYEKNIQISNFENITDELQIYTSIDHNYTNSLLELSFECLEMTEFNNQVIEDELIYLLLKIQVSYEARQNVMKILSYLMLSSSLNQSLKQTIFTKFKINDTSIAIFFKRTLDQSINPNFVDNNYVYLIIQISCFQLMRNQFDLVFSFLYYLKSLFKLSCSQKLLFIYAAILLGMMEKLQVSSKQLIVSFLGVFEFQSIKIFHLNDAFNFENMFYRENNTRILEECNKNLFIIENLIKPKLINFDELDIYLQKTQSIDAVSSLMPSIRSPDINMKSRSSYLEQFEPQQYLTLNSVKSGFDELMQKLQKIRIYEDQMYLKRDPLDSLVG